MALTPRTFVCAAAAFASARIVKKTLMSRFFDGGREHAKKAPEPCADTLIDLAVSASASRRVYEPPETFFEGRDMTGYDAMRRARFLECAPSSGEDAEAYAWLVSRASFKKSILETEAVRFHEEMSRTCFFGLNDGEETANDDRFLTLYVVFRGTESKKDMLANLELLTEKFSEVGARAGEEYSVSAPRKEEGEARVHSGFLDQFRALEPHITEYLSKNRASCSRVVFAGHSLGGALATIATLYYASRSFRSTTPSLPPIYCHTFGSPRVGDDAFCAAFERYVTDYRETPNSSCFAPPENGMVRHWRVYDYEDPVPMVPISCRFSHVMRDTLCIGDHLRSRACGGGSDTHWSLRPIYGFFSLDPFDPIGPHDCGRYFRRLRSLAQWRKSWSIHGRCLPLR